MAGFSDIEWTDATWNPITGCAMVSPGCTNCYAMRMASRLQSMGHPLYAGITRKSGGRPVWTGKLHLSHRALEVPLTWKKPRKIFVNSMSDLFQEGVPPHFIGLVWKTMRSAGQHIFQILTKRPDRMRHVIESLELPILPNVWLGTSVESDELADRIETLKKVPSAVRFVSFEPLIGAVGAVDLLGIHWAIIGGESGPNARPLQLSWVDEIELQCRKSGTAFFFKQWGGTNKKAAGRTYRGQTWDEFPEAIRPSTVPSS
jgi:protein gp37